MSLDSAKTARRNAVEQMIYRNLDLPVRLGPSERALWAAFMMNRAQKLYYVALAADNQFQRELVRVYGAKQVHELRYASAHTDPELIAAREVFHIEMEAYLAACVESRTYAARY